MAKTKEEFMAVFKGVPAHLVAKAFNRLQFGISFTGCSKGHLAEVWSGEFHKIGYEQVQKLTLEQIEDEVEAIRAGN
jgi:hypothetical protein